MSFIFLPRAEVSPSPCQGLFCVSSPSPVEGESESGAVVLTSGSLSFNMLCRLSGTAMCMLVSNCLLVSNKSVDAVIMSVYSCLPS